MPLTGMREVCDGARRHVYDAAPLLRAA